MKRTISEQWMELAAEVRALKRKIIIILTKPIIKLYELIENLVNKLKQ